MVATLASNDGEFLRKISHQLIWWLHRKPSNSDFVVNFGLGSASLLGPISLIAKLVDIS
jgi:hypothetical protein